MASNSNGDDASSPTPKRTRLSNADDVNDQQEKVIQALEKSLKNPSSVLALSKSLTCDACKSFARSPIHYCDNHHTVCSICSEEYLGYCPVEGCGEEELILNTYDSVTEVVRAMKLPVPCKNRSNGCPNEGTVREMEDHELECEFRFVDPGFLAGGRRMFKDLMSLMDDFVKKNKGKWQITNSGLTAYWDSIGPDGHIFSVIIRSYNATFMKAYAYVMGGETVANGYRVEMRLSSCEKEFTLTHHGPVFPVDIKAKNCEESFLIAKERFAVFNKGFDKFGDHNKNENGEVVIPMMVKIIKKELNIPKEDSCSGVDMEVEEK